MSETSNTNGAEVWAARYVDDDCCDRIYWRVVSYVGDKADVVADDLDEETARSIAADHNAAARVQVLTEYLRHILAISSDKAVIETANAALLAYRSDASATVPPAP